LELTWAQEEMVGVEVWDARCRRSLARICESLAERPVTAFSVACGPALRQAAHRIFDHRTTSVGGLLQGHSEQTRARIAAVLQEGPAPFVLLLQDTTVLDYSGHVATTGLGPIGIKPEQRGLLAHSVLAVPCEGPALGLVHLAVWARDTAAFGQCRDAYAAAQRPTDAKESQKWIDGLRGAEAALGTELPFLLIQDREADVFDFLAAERQPNAHLLIRAAQPRRVLLTAPAASLNAHRQRKAAQTLWDALRETAPTGSMEVEVPRAPGRAARTATLVLRLLPAWVVPPLPRKATPATRQRQPVQVWVVQAEELQPPPGVAPLNWVLVSTLPIPDATVAQQFVGYYARRWMIEQLHLVLKSGLQIERLQCDEARRLQHALALYYVVAWRILHLRDVARFFPELPAEEVFSTAEREVLEAVERHPLPTVRSALRAVAHLAGFPRNPSAGEPGIKSLWEGFRRLEAMLLGWELAQGER
jgi:hypothetical protein